MNFQFPRLALVCLLLSLVSLTGCIPSAKADITKTESGQTYNNQMYSFSFEVPSGWQVQEVSAQDLVGYQEVWLAARDFPPANTGARPDILLIVTEDDPSAQWKADYFDDYRSEVISVGEGEATHISGINKESLFEESVLIMKLGEIYLQAFQNTSREAGESFERVLESLSPLPEALVVPGATAQTASCVSPYFDPVAFLPDQERILIRADSGMMVFDLKTLENEIVLESSEQVIKAALSPDGRILAWALDDHSIELIDLESGKVLQKLEGHSAIVTAIKFSATDGKIYTASHDNTVRVWNADGELDSELYPGGGEVLGIDISSDDTKLSLVTFEGPQKLWNLEANELIGETSPSGAFDGADASFSPDGKLLGVGLGGGPVSVWDVETLTQLWSGGDYAISLSPDGNTFAYTDTQDNGNHVVVIVGLDRMEPIHILEGGSSLIWKIIFSPYGSRVASADGNEIRVWQVNDGTLLYALRSVCP